MGKPAATVMFSGGLGSPASFSVVPPSPNIDAPVTTPKAVARTQGGTLVLFQIGASYWETTLVFEYLSNADKGNLESFFRNNPISTWQYVDENSNTFNAQFLDAALPLTKSQRDLWVAHVHLNLSAVLK